MQLIPPSLPTGDPSPQIQDGCPQGSSPCRCPGVCKGREMHLGAIKVFLGEMGKRDNRYIIKCHLIFQVIEKCPVPSFLGQGDPMIHAMVGLSTLPLGKPTLVNSAFFFHAAPFVSVSQVLLEMMVTQMRPDEALHLKVIIILNMKFTHNK